VAAHADREAQRKLLDCLNRERSEKLVHRGSARRAAHGARGGLPSSEALDRRPRSATSRRRLLDPKIERDRLADELARAADHFKTLTRAAERLLEPSVKVVR
jgi:hypothetical protein